jgi:hypothetical protein
MYFEFTMGTHFVNGLYIALFDLKCFSFISLLLPYYRKGIRVCCTFVNMIAFANQKYLKPTF